MGVTRQDVERIARLAELAVDDAAARELEAQLSRILDYVAQLARVSDAGPGAAASDRRAARLRPDVPSADPLTRPLEDIAPAFKDGLFTVPRLGELDRGNDVP